MALYTFVRFRKSRTRNKKYDAIIRRKTTGREYVIPFGDSRYQQYKDATGLGLYSYLDHQHERRRALFRARQEKHIAENYYSPAYFSFYYLW